MRRIIAVIAVTATLLLTSCSLGDSFLGSLGFDVHDYAAEQVIAEPSADSEIAERISAIVGYLVYSSPYLTEFDSPREVVAEYRDEILANMLLSGYARYTGESSSLTEAQQAYPRMTVTSLIPADEFENVVYTNFGGSDKVSHSDGEIFTYLSKVTAYTSVTVPDAVNATVTLTSLVETENTYKAKLTVTVGEITSPEYSALVIKREDGTIYIKSIE